MKQVKEFLSYARKINPSFLSASITFYLLFMIIPIITLLTSVMSLLEIDYINTNHSLDIISFIVLLFSVIWVSSSVVSALDTSTHIIYNTHNKKSFIRKTLFSFFVVFILIFLIIILIVSAFFLLYFLEFIIGIKAYTPFIVIQFILQFSIILVLISVIYKYLIPVHIKFRKTLFMSLMTTIIWYILLFLYRIIIHQYFITSYNKLYGSFAPILIAIFILYLMVNIFLYIILINYYIVKIYHVNNDKIST